MKFNYKFITPVIFKSQVATRIKKLNDKDTIILEKNVLTYTTDIDFVSKKGLKDIDSLNEHLNKEIGYNLKYNGYSKENVNNIEMGM